jgi:hypothetical protein
MVGSQIRTQGLEIQTALKRRCYVQIDYGRRIRSVDQEAKQGIG